MGHDIPAYAILSHTWGEDEVSFQDMQAPTVTEKRGYAKIEYSCERALQDGLSYVWVDTCCIDKTSSAELSEAINSMMAWYAQSRICYAHLADVPPITDQDFDKAAFSQSRWFTRGWTLQELIAPCELVFLAQDWSFLVARETVAELISDITGISHLFLEARPDNEDLKSNLMSTSIAERMSWASERETTRTEDMAYSLLGILQVNMPLLYGEGSAAFRRLREEIIKHSDDQSLLAWGFGTPDHDLSHKRPWSAAQSSLAKIVSFFKEYSAPPEATGAMDMDISDMSGILAESPAAFRGCGDIVPCDVKRPTPSFSMTNRGLSIELPVLQLADGYFSLLQCQMKKDPTKLIALPIRRLRDNTFCRSKRGNYVASHSAWLTWSWTQLYFIPSNDSAIARFLDSPLYSIAIKSLPPNLRIAEILPARPFRQADSMVIYTKSPGVSDFDANIFVRFEDLGNNNLSFILLVMVINPSWARQPLPSALIPYLYLLPPPDDSSPLVRDIRSWIRRKDREYLGPVPYSVKITTQTLSQSGLWMIDIIPESRDKKAMYLEMRKMRSWVGILRWVLRRDPLVENVYGKWLDYLCERGFRLSQVLMLSPLCFTFPFDLVLEVCIGSVVPHIMANKANLAAIVSASYLLSKDDPTMHKIRSWLFRKINSEGTRNLLLLYIMCKCIPSHMLLSLAGEEGAYHED